MVHIGTVFGCEVSASRSGLSDRWLIGTCSGVCTTDFWSIEKLYKLF